LDGIKVLEIAGLAPAPYCGLILADFGADVVRVDKHKGSNNDSLARGKRSIALDLKDKSAIELLLKLVEKADVLIEPFRPGVMEKLGLSPEVLLKRNPRLIFARMTGFGQTGPYSRMGGHDIDYIAISGALNSIRRVGENPLAPINLLGDFAGGGMLCAMGILLALIERSRSGKGQVVDAAMCDGAAYLMAFVFKGRASGLFAREPGLNTLDTGAPFYETYRTKDGKFMAVGAIEPQFYAAFMKGMGLEGNADFPTQFQFDKWPEMKKTIARIFASKTRAEWCGIFDGTDACVAPILEIDEVMDHPHNKERKTLIWNEETGAYESSPAPRLSRTPGHTVVRPMPEVGQHIDAVIKDWDVKGVNIDSLVASGSVARAKL